MCWHHGSKNAMLNRAVASTIPSILLAFSLFVGRCCGWNIALEITAQVDGAFGGSPFQTQPVVAVKNLVGELQTTFEGRMAVRLSSNNAMLRKEDEIGDISTDIIYGVATFSGLSIDAANEGYQLQFTLYDEDDLVMGTVIGAAFVVEVGNPFALEVITHPESAYGGGAFGIQPVLAVKDRGGNIVSSVNEGTVTVSLLHQSSSTALRCDGQQGCFTAAINDGLASFRGLYINEADTYSLHFVTDLTLDGSSEVVSNTFSVGDGPAASIVLVQDASDGAVFGGNAFTVQPRVEVHDEGGNVLRTDSRSAIQVSIYSNPSGGVISSIQGTIATLDRGVAQFRGLSIDKAGEDYRLMYSFLKYEEDRLVGTSVSKILGEPFDVSVGQPHKLSVLRTASKGWAGNQPFSVQPKVGLVDAGGNVIVGDSAAIVAAEVTPSIPLSSYIIVDTRNDAIPSIERVSFGPSIISDHRVLYGPGDVIDITVEFSQEVALFRNSNETTPPTLALNVINGGSVDAVLAELWTAPIEGLASITLQFKYTVRNGDSQIDLNYKSVDALQPNGYMIKDAFGRSADLTLPSLDSELSLSGSKSIGVSDNSPSIVSIDVDFPAGEHKIGAGDVVELIVSFDREVMVNGYPELPIQVDSTVVAIDTSTSGTIRDGSNFVVTYKGEESEPIPWNASALEVKRVVEAMDNVMGDVCVSRDVSPNASSAGGFRWAIRLESIDDNIFELGVDGAGMQFSDEGDLQMQIHTTNRVRDAWSIADGDVGMCTVRTATYFKGSGSQSLHFRFQVINGDYSEGLNLVDGTNLLLSGSDSISLLVNEPNQSPVNADCRIDGLSLSSDHRIAIDTVRPKVTSVIPQPATTPNGLYTVGDALYFEVTFDKPVQVEIGLEMKLNAGNDAVARYFSGSGSNTLLLEYLVQEGDSTAQLDFESLVAENTEGGRGAEAGYVRRQSILPSTDADLNLHHLDHFSKQFSIGIDGSKPILTGVSIHERDAGRLLARKDELTIAVQFNAPVEVDTSAPPLLGLLVRTNKRWAEYSSGSGSSTLLFVYSVLVGDAATPGDLKYTRICRREDCRNLEGLILRLSSTPVLDADLEQGFSSQGTIIAPNPDDGVTIDTSLSVATTVDSVAVALDAGIYSAGTVVDIQVKFTDDVFVSGFPAISLNTVSQAIYSAGHGTNTLHFRFITTVNDVASQLDWTLYSSTNSAIICSVDCSIVNGNQVEVDTSFDGVQPLSATIVFDPSPATILSVGSSKDASPYCHPQCSYTVGEEIMISVVFDRQVAVLGTEIFLPLDIGDDSEEGKAVFDPFQSSESELVFVYTVRHGHSSNGANLNYICELNECSIELKRGASIKGASSEPTVDADLRLPIPTLGISRDESNPIIIDTRGQPQVMEVSTTSADRKYSPGDVIEIAVVFSEHVVVRGEPFLALNVGSNDGVATYHSGSGSDILLFQYRVGVNDWTLDLDYIDAHSLFVGMDGVHIGSIKQASTSPTIDALLDLPSPSTAGSLSHLADLIIDNRRPHISSISATANDCSPCNTGKVVLVQVQFSRSVTVNGTPSLKLETGVVDRFAVYESQLDDRTLEFKYTVKLGDSTQKLDYWSDDELLPSSIESFQLNGGWIRSSSENPVLDADLHLNPVGGYLDGKKGWQVNEGVVIYRDLKIGKRGKDYKIRYSSSIPGAVLETEEDIEVGISIEYEVQGDLNNRDDSYGRAVTIHEDVVVVGSPGKRIPVHEVQVLTVHSESSIVEHEVQIITTSVNKQEAIISVHEFSTCADPGETIGGSFKLAFQEQGSYAFASHVIKLDSDATAEKLETTLESELALIGLVSTSRTANYGCESLNSWTWSVTFLDSSYRNGVFETNGDDLSIGSHVTPASITRAVDMLSGEFTILNPSNMKESRPIPYNASASFLKTAIQNDLSIAIKSVQVENIDPDQAKPELGRRWIIFFSHHFSSSGLDVDIPQLQVSGDGLNGSGAVVWTHTTFEGRGPLSGSFALSFRGCEFSQLISHDSTEEELQEALQSLESINEVRVSGRREFKDRAGKSGVTWTITFLSTNKLTEYGWLPDPDGASSRGNLPTLEVASSLIGWKAGYEVRSETGRGQEDTQAQWMQQQMGDDGLNSGSVDVFHRTGETWTKEATLFASDHDSNDLFGHSLSLTENFLLVGAPHKQVNGLPERQTLTCSGPASDGFFTIGFRGFESSPIPHDATMDVMETAIIGTYGDTSQIHPLPRIILLTDEWDGSSTGFCSESETSVHITFLTPDGGGISTVEHLSGDIEAIQITSTNLTGASLSVSEARAGTKAPMGLDTNTNHATGKQSGSAYLYKRNIDCITCTPYWIEEAKFTPLGGLDDATDAALFGWSSKFIPASETRRALAIIGSPGFDQDSGKVYVFEQVDDDWLIMDTLTDRNWNHNAVKGSRFGSSLDADADNILVGSPGYSSGRGAVYVFQRSEDGHFLASHAIYAPDDTEGDQLGHAISLSNNKAAICAPYKAVSAIHIKSPQSIAQNAGACYVFYRSNPASSFQIEQQLTPSNLLAGDRFGWDVSMDRNRILVGQMEDFTDKLTPPRPIQVIKTYCEAPPCHDPDLSLLRLRLMIDDSIVWTPYLAANSSANRLRDVIENTLSSGEVSVSRSLLPDDNGGHSWTVTFDSYKTFFRTDSEMQVFECETSSKSSLSCSVVVANAAPQTIRSKAHLFDFDESLGAWTEQAFLFPSTPQRQDLFGAAVSISRDFAVVGAPNRDSVNINSGAAFMFDTSFMDLKFVGSPYIVNEGDSLTIEVTRDSSSNQLVSLRSFDKNAQEELQQYINDLYSLRTLELYPYSKTSIDILTSATALGRNQYYGSEEKRSLFVAGQYDFLGISDYELLSYEGQFKSHERSKSIPLKTNDDHILEKNENVTIQFNLRGMFASQLGRLHTSASIIDDGDGIGYYQVITESIQHEESFRLGSAIDFDESSRMTVICSEKASDIDANDDRLDNVGSAHIFRNEANGSWVHVQTLLPPENDVRPDMLFCHSVAINTPYGRADTTVLVGSPGISVSYIYTFDTNTISWALQAKLSVSEATLPEHRYGESVALYGDMAFVGAPELETVYAFRRLFVEGQGFANWELYSQLRADYDFDVYGQDFTIHHLHRQSFGLALAADRRSLLIGAPYADYGNRGNINSRETFNTNGIHNQGLGKGKVYAFYSQPHVHLIKLTSDEIIKSGSFRLMLSNYQGIEEEFSELISHNASVEDVKASLEAMKNVGEVKVEMKKSFNDKIYEISWRITFLSSFEDAHPLLVPHWSDTGCADCVQFGVSVLSTIRPYLTATLIHTHQPFVREAELQPRDVTSTDLFGSSMDIDGPQALLGSKRSSAKTRTTWDFETGDLIGWSVTGDAFRYQPTYGDNSKHRSVYESLDGHSTGKPQSSQLVGRYCIGTFEKRPGDKEESYQKPSDLYPTGSFQGDEPQGTMTSDPFIILGETISFMIGGGCNHLTVYVELLVDGFSALRATGRCHERMERVYFDVSDFISRSGQIRVVDKGSRKWDHINFDDVRFSWRLTSSHSCLVNNDGACSTGGGAIPKLNPADHQHYAGQEETAKSGAAYLFYRQCSALDDLDDTSPSNLNCHWLEQERITASDKRAGNEFGTSVSVDNTQGVAIVGSSNSPAYGFYNEPIFVHPHSNATTFSFPIPEILGHHKIKSGLTYSTTGGSIRVMDYLAKEYNVPIEEMSKYTEQAGMTYVFLREPTTYGPSGNVVREAYWRTTEHARIAPPDISSRDHFGYSVALRGTTAVMGAIGRDGHELKSGSAFSYDMEWIRVKFASVEYIAVEGKDHQIKIFLQRDLAWSNAAFSIGYSASDLSAIGVDTTKYEDCMRLHASGRDGCGDYEQAAGEVTFNEGEEFTYFTVRIIDDLCTERDMEFIQLNLHQFGGSVLRGENYRAQLRIDDNDFETDTLSMKCRGGIS